MGAFLLAAGEAHRVLTSLQAHSDTIQERSGAEERTVSAREAGISNEVIHNQASYVAGWLKKLRDDRKLLIHAAAQAQKAADYILNRTCHE